MDALPYILAIDDEPINRFVLEDLLEEGYELQLLESGQACLESVALRAPDLILLDINMPDMDGYEVCKRLQADPLTREIPIIFLTARIQVSEEKKGFELGAVDYITKPFSEALLLARIKTHLSLAQSKSQLAQHNAFLQKERAYIERIILNMRNDADFVDESIQYLITPVEKTNGDLLLSAKSGGHRYFLIGDFTGHGLAAAMGGPLVSSLFYMLANEQQPLELIVEVLNQELYKKMPTDLFMAGLFIDWDTQAQRVKIWNYGLSDVFHYRDNELINSVSSSGLALGILDKPLSMNPSAVLAVEKGDRLYGFSDGLVEAKSESRELFGKQRLCHALQKINDHHFSLDDLYGELNRFAAKDGITDDITLLEIQV
ncbi:MAG: SpoIIE family protein phosphatase [Thiotrichales bacterium]|nr:SpoIIE family protein phosphatase [Thiotrichales bacterium]